MPMGRPTLYCPEVAQRICELLSQGQTLRKICALHDDLPALPTVLRWLSEPDKAEFRDQYKKARQEQADYFVDEIVDLADKALGLPSEGVQALKLMVDARKWHASKTAPKKYGDRQIVQGDDSADPVRVENKVSVTAELLKHIPTEVLQSVVDKNETTRD